MKTRHVVLQDQSKLNLTLAQLDSVAQALQTQVDRDFTRDYREGEPGFGSCPPEGLVYFPEVLGFYLQHRPASRLLAPPNPNEPLGQAMARVKQK